MQMHYCKGLGWTRVLKWRRTLVYQLAKTPWRRNYPLPGLHLKRFPRPHL